MNIQFSLDQFNQLLSATPSQPVQMDMCVVGCSLLESFLGSLALLFHGIMLATKYQLVFVQCDRGVYTYRTDNLMLTLAMDGAILKCTLKPARGGWVLIRNRMCSQKTQHKYRPFTTCPCT